MALLRKDIKIGFLAGAALIGLGATYAIVLSFTGGPNSADASPNDPLGNAGDIIAAPLTTPEGEPSLADGGSNDSGALQGASSGTWDDFADGNGQAVVTQTPTPGMTSQTIDGDIEPPFIPDYNAPQGFAGLGNTAPITPPVTPPAVSTDFTIHTIASGDNFTSLAEQYYGDARLTTVIQDANPTVDSRRLKLGQQLKIPARAAAQAAADQPRPSAIGTHTIASGETLSQIAARRLGSSAKWQEIYDLNRDLIGSDPAALKVGMVLKLPQ